MLPIREHKNIFFYSVEYRRLAFLKKIACACLNALIHFGQIEVHPLDEFLVPSSYRAISLCRKFSFRDNRQSLTSLLVISIGPRCVLRCFSGTELHCDKQVPCGLYLCTWNRYKNLYHKEQEIVNLGGAVGSSFLTTKLGDVHVR